DREVAAVETRQLFGRAVDAADLGAMREMGRQLGVGRGQRMAGDYRGALLLAFLLFPCGALCVALRLPSLLLLPARPQRIAAGEVVFVRRGFRRRLVLRRFLRRLRFVRLSRLATAVLSSLGVPAGLGRRRLRGRSGLRGLELLHKSTFQQLVAEGV